MWVPPQFFWCSLRGIAPFLQTLVIQVASLKVKDDHNCSFILKMMSIVGLVVPTTIVTETALKAVGTKFQLLGDSAEPGEIEASATAIVDDHGQQQILL